MIVLALMSICALFPLKDKERVDHVKKSKHRQKSNSIQTLIFFKTHISGAYHRGKVVFCALEQQDACEGNFLSLDHVFPMDHQAA